MRHLAYVLSLILSAIIPFEVTPSSAQSTLHESPERVLTPGPNPYNDTLGLLKKWVNTGKPEDLIPLLALGDSRSSEFLTALDFLNAFLLHPLPIHTVKRVHALLLLYAVASARIAA